MSVAAAARGSLSVIQGELEPQLLQWLQMDPYWTHIIGACAASVERPSIIEEGGYTGCKPPSCSTLEFADCSNPLGARRVVAFVHAFRSVNTKWLQDMGQACRKYLMDVREDDDMEEQYVDYFREQREHLNYFFDERLAETAFSHGFIQVYKASDYHGNALFDDDASLLLGGLTVCGQRVVDHLSKKCDTATSDNEGADTASSSESCGDDEACWWSIPQEPGSFYIGNYSASKHRVAHAVEPLECPSKCSHIITVTLCTDMFNTRREGEELRSAAYGCDTHLRGYVNTAVARFMSDRRPRVPSLSDVIEAFQTM